MSRFGPVNWAQTVHLLGDIHVGIVNSPSRPVNDGTQMFRLWRVRDDLNRIARRGYQPLGTIQVGDLIDGNGAAEVDRANTYMASLPWQWCAAIGNHDLASVSSTPNTTAWASYWGPRFTLTAATVTDTNYAVDLGPFRAVIGDWRTPNFAAHTALLDADTSKPTIVVIHKPLADTVHGLVTPSPRWGPQPTSALSDASSDLSATTLGVPNYGAALPINYAAYAAAYAARPHVKVYATGHVHTAADTPGQVMTKDVGGGKRILSVNAGSPYNQGLVYAGASNTGRGPWGDPLLSYFLEMGANDKTWTVYCRDHGHGVWTSLAGAARSLTLTVS